jgi:TPP-dependent indolepyruvate ferredoxin oxidoreductase alpha subunit
MSANQALVRLPLEQARRDRAAGLATAGYISGYRGSPLGVYDSALWGAQQLLDEHNIVFSPASTRNSPSARFAARSNWRGSAHRRSKAYSGCGTARASASTAPANR